MQEQIQDLKFLVVDGQRTIRQIIKDQILKMGAKEVMAVRDGSLAWIEIEKNISENNHFDFVIFDQEIDGIIGTDLMKKCKEAKLTDSTVFIMATVHSEPSHVKKAKQSGVDQVLVKPFHPDQLKEKISAGMKKISKG